MLDCPSPELSFHLSKNRTEALKCDGINIGVLQQSTVESAPGKVK